MSCEEVREFLDAYIDRELDVVGTLQFERHLTECASCRAISEQYQDLDGAVRAKIPYFEAPEELEKKIRAQLSPAGRRQDRTVRGEWFLRWRGWAAAASLAALLIVGVVIGNVARRPSAAQIFTDQVVASHIRSLMANHLTDVISSDQHTVKPWFSGKLDFAPVVKDLSSVGFPLVGGRLDYIDNRPVAALVYRHRQHTINLFLWPSSDSDSGPRATTIKGYNVVHGTRSHMTYWAVSDLNAAELNQFVHDLEK
jgi:anti-sigma factor RsiW